MTILDKIDRKLLSALDRNARLPLSQLAKRIRFSRDVVNYRLKRLENEGIIRGYHAFVDASRLSFRMYRVYLKFYSITSKDSKELLEMLSKSKNIFWVGETDGFADLVFGACFPTGKMFNEFYISIIERFRPVIKQEFVHELLSYSYLDRAYLGVSKAERTEMMVGGNDKEEFDGKDIEILKILSNDARTSLVDIANTLKMDSASIIYRIRNLEKRNIIVGYKADLNLASLKRSFYSIKLYLSRFERKKELLTYLRSKPIVTNFTRSIGSWDVEFDAEVENDAQYHHFVQELKERFDFISEISFFRVTRNIKVTNLPL